MHRRARPLSRLGQVFSTTADHDYDDTMNIRSPTASDDEGDIFVATWFYMKCLGIVAMWFYILDIFKMVFRYLKRPIAIFVVFLLLLAFIPFGASLAWGFVTLTFSNTELSCNWPCEQSLDHDRSFYQARLGPRTPLTQREHITERR